MFRSIVFRGQEENKKLLMEQKEYFSELNCYWHLVAKAINYMTIWLTALHSIRAGSKPYMLQSMLEILSFLSYTIVCTIILHLSNERIFKNVLKIYIYIFFFFYVNTINAYQTNNLPQNAFFAHSKLVDTKAMRLVEKKE